MNNAIQASPIATGGRNAVIEIKRTTTQVGSSGRGRFSSGREGYGSDSFKSRGNYGGGRAYGRNEYESQGGFLWSRRIPSGRCEGCQQGRGRGGRPMDQSKMFSYETLWGEFSASIFDKTVYMVNASIKEVQMI